MSTNCAPLLADLFLYLYEADCIHSLFMKNKKKLVLSFNSTFCYIDDVLSISNSKLGDFVDHLYPVEIGIRAMSASCIYPQIKVDSECWLRA
jgi:hypothetical protein